MHHHLHQILHQIFHTNLKPILRAKISWVVQSWAFHVLPNDTWHHSLCMKPLSWEAFLMPSSFPSSSIPFISFSMLKSDPADCLVQNLHNTIWHAGFVSLIVPTEMSLGVNISTGMKNKSSQGLTYKSEFKDSKHWHVTSLFLVHQVYHLTLEFIKNCFLPPPIMYSCVLSRAIHYICSLCQHHPNTKIFLCVNHTYSEKKRKPSDVFYMYSYV